MKTLIIKLLHSIIGYSRYLKWFTIIKIWFLKMDSRKSDYLFFTKLLGEKSTVLVIGANTGMTTIPFASSHPKRKIYAYEPLKSNFDCLNSLVSFFSCLNVSTYQVGLADKNGVEKMILPKEKGAKKHGMSYVLAYNQDHKLKGDSFEVKLSRLDDREELKDIEVHAIKIVAENSEFEIFSGGNKLIGRWKPIIYCELWDNEHRAKTMNLIKSMGYEIYFRKGKELVPFKQELYKGKNFVFKYVG